MCVIGKGSTCRYCNGGCYKGGAGVVIFNYYWDRRLKKYSLRILLGRETGGKYTGKYSFACGGRKNQDNCVSDTAMRELYEEFGLSLDPSSYIGLINSNGPRNGTPMLVFLVVGLSTTKMNTTGWVHDWEMDHFDWFNLETGLMSQGKGRVSEFVTKMLRRFNITSHMLNEWHKFDNLPNTEQCIRKELVKLLH